MTEHHGAAVDEAGRPEAQHSEAENHGAAADEAVDEAALDEAGRPEADHHIQHPQADPPEAAQCLSDGKCPEAPGGGKSSLGLLAERAQELAEQSARGAVPPEALQGFQADIQRRINHSTAPAAAMSTAMGAFECRTCFWRNKTSSMVCPTCQRAFCPDEHNYAGEGQSGSLQMCKECGESSAGQGSSPGAGSVAKAIGQQILICIFITHKNDYFNLMKFYSISSIFFKFHLSFFFVFSSGSPLSKIQLSRGNSAVHYLMT